MAYEKQTWVPYDDNKTEEENIQNGAVVTAERINHLETGLDEHDKNTTNPHKVTKAQVGLGNVTNVEQATKTDLETVKREISENVDNQLDSINVKKAWSWSADGTDRFTKVYPNENLVVTGNEYVGKMLEQNGNLVDNSTSNIMREKIQVSPGETLYFQKTSSETLDFWRGNWHKSDGTFLSRFANAINKFTMTVPTEAAFLWISYPNTGTNKIERSGYTFYTPSPIDDPINAYPTYKGISIADSDNPADYSWQAEDNTIAKKATLDSHTENISNPHKVTKTQIGLGNVDNYSTATQAEAEAGTATNKFMTPALVFKAIAKWVQGKFVSTTGSETVLGVKNFQDGLQVGGNPVGLVNDVCWCEDFTVNNLTAGIVNPDIQRFSTSNAEAFSMSGKTITVKKAGVYLITLGVNYTGLSGWVTFGISRLGGTSLVNRNLLGSSTSGSNSLTYVRS
ncbi:hypothetical protein P7D39_13830, partial [Enterococcus dongliensis]|nr:hypothetical protein [Enterococcus dongliensis]